MGTPPSTPTRNDALLRKKIVEDEIAILKHDKERLEKDLAELLSQHRAAEEQHKKQLAAMHAELASGELHLREMDSEARRYERDIRSKSTRLENLDIEMQRNEEFLMEQTRTMDRKRKDMDQLDHEHQLLVASVVKERDALALELNTLENNHEKALDRLRLLSSKHKQIMEEMEKKKQELDDRYNEVEEKEQRFKAYERRISSVYQKLYPNIKLRV